MQTKSHQIVTHIINKDFNKAKTLIHESMNEKLLEYAPTIMEAKAVEVSPVGDTTTPR